MVETLEMHNHTKHCGEIVNPTLKRKWKFWTTFYDPFFYHQNVGIKLGPWNKKLFNIELVFRIFLNPSISMLESKVMIKTLDVRNHTKPHEENRKSHIKGKSLLSLPYLLI